METNFLTEFYYKFFNSTFYVLLAQTRKTKFFQKTVSVPFFELDEAFMKLHEKIKKVLSAVQEKKLRKNAQTGKRK